MTDTNAPERIWLTREDTGASWSGSFRVFRACDLEHEDCPEYIRADLATPAPREDGYSAGVRAAAEQCDFADSLELALHGVEPTRQRILALLDAPALPDARAGAVEPVASEAAQAVGSIEGLLEGIRQIVADAKADRDRFGHIAATIRVNALHHGASDAEAEAMVRGETNFVTWIADKIEKRPTPACTATDGPASACVYRAPGLGTNEYGDDIPGRIPDYD